MLPGKKRHLLQRLIAPQVFILILYLNLGISHGNDMYHTASNSGCIGRKDSKKVHGVLQMD